MSKIPESNPESDSESPESESDFNVENTESELESNDFLKSLNANKIDILILRFNDNLSQRENAEKVGFSQSTVSRILKDIDKPKTVNVPKPVAKDTHETSPKTYQPTERIPVQRG